MRSSLYRTPGISQWAHPDEPISLIIDEQQIPIHAVRLCDKEIRHYTVLEYPSIVGRNCLLQIDQERRILHAKLHTGGHLIGNIVESAYTCFQAVKGHHFPGECYVEFTVKPNHELQESELNDLQIIKFKTKGNGLKIHYSLFNSTQSS